MRVKDLLEELTEAEVYKSFKKKNPDAFFSAGFFILDLKNKTEQIQLDFFLPKEKRIAGFEFPFKEVKIFEDKIESMKELSTEINLDIDDLDDEVKKIVTERNYSIRPSKMIAILKEGVWNLTCMDEILNIVRIHVNAKTKEVIKFNNGSLMDFMGVKKGDKK